jgi:membrane protein implicated in regulation of membrane protease activity
MDWSHATWWWIATGVLVAVELATGTFYLLMLGVGTVAAALAAHAGLDFTGQLAAGAVIGGGATAAWHLKRSRERQVHVAGGNRDVNLDVGERVTVLHWRPDGSTQVSYRGASWSARFAGSGTPQPGAFVIRAVEGNRLMLDRLPA